MHSPLGLTSPRPAASRWSYARSADALYGGAAAVRDRRAHVLATPQTAYPERFAGGGTPTPPNLPGPAWISKPKQDQTDERKETPKKPTQNQLSRLDQIDRFRRTSLRRMIRAENQRGVIDRRSDAGSAYVVSRHLTLTRDRPHGSVRVHGATAPGL